jgi:hypothetical protein
MKEKISGLTEDDIIKSRSSAYVKPKVQCIEDRVLELEKEVKALREQTHQRDFPDDPHTAGYGERNSRPRCYHGYDDPHCAG